MLTFEREDGKTMCLRPDLTVASCISFLKKRSSSKIYYSGQAYRRSGNKGINLISDQLGIEILGSKNKIQDDFKVVSTILSSAKKIKRKKITIKIGDISLFKNLINALEMPERWKFRLIRHFWRPNYFKELLRRLEKNTDIDAITFDADKKRFYEMRKKDQDKMIAGRSYREILSRYENKLQNPRLTKTGKYTAKVIKEFLKIKTPLKDAPHRLNKFFKKYNLGITVGRGFFPVTNFSQKNLKYEFSASNGRGKEVDYYDSFNFSINIKLKNKTINYITGGRYNNMAQKNLGLKKIPAVGAAINLGIYE